MPHIHDLIDFTADVFIVHDHRVLLIFHKKHKMWLAVGGHIELNEDPEEAALREVKEECGLDVELLGEKPQIMSPGTKFLITPAFLDIHDVTPTHKHIAFRYFATSKTSQFSNVEHDDIRWFSQEDLDNPEFGIKPDIQFYAKEALNKVK